MMVLLLRIWMQWVECDIHNQFSKFIVKLTQPVISIFNNIIPSVGSASLSVGSASLLLAIVLAIIKLPLLMWFEMRVLIINKFYLFVGLLALLKTIGELCFWIVIIRSLLSWIIQGRRPLDLVLYQLSEPLLYPIRRRLPPGGIDFSVMIVIVMLYALNYLGMELFPHIWKLL